MKRFYKHYKITICKTQFWADFKMSKDPNYMSYFFLIPSIHLSFIYEKRGQSPFI